jgi:8-oxo-dGTP diphosphatase
VRGDGDGWVECVQGHRHWGRHGAAGLLLRAVDDDGTVRVLTQHRAEWTHDGGTWGIPGGARDSHEDATEAALREAHEETALDVAAVRVRGASAVEHGGWGYTTVLADTPHPLPVEPNAESAELRWVPESEVSALPLHPGFGAAWPRLRARAVTVVVDGANVVGSRPDGWWRDRAGAAQRLHDALEGLRTRVTRLPGDELVVVRRAVLVLEGAARAAVTDGSGWVVVRRAERSGDDEIAAAAHAHADEAVVVTADRGLRERLPDGACPVGPRWLLDALER